MFARYYLFRKILQDEINTFFSFATIKNWKGFASTGIKRYYQDFREKGPWSSASLHSLNVWYNIEKIQHSCQSE